MTKKKNNKTTKLATVTNITEALAQQNQMVVGPPALTLAAALSPQPASNTTEPPKRKKGLARCYKLDAATKVTTALLTVQHQRTSILAITGWNQRLRMAVAAPHAANAFAKDAHSEGLIPAYLYSHALGMTIARCMDYGVTHEEAASLIQKAIEKKVNEAVSPNG